PRALPERSTPIPTKATAGQAEPRSSRSVQTTRCPFFGKRDQPPPGAERRAARVCGNGPRAPLEYDCGVPTKKRSRPVAIAYVQEFTIQNGDPSTANYDAV